MRRRSANEARESTERLARLASVDRQWLGAAAVELCRDDFEKQAPTDLLYGLGYWVLGPAITNFIHRVIRRLAGEEVRLAVFPAREGFVLRAVFEKLCPAVLDGCAIPSVYAFLTRGAVVPASIARIGARELQIATKSSSRAVTLGGFLRRLALQGEEVLPLARRCGLDSLEHVLADPRGDAGFLRLIEDPHFLAILGANQQRHREILDAYLDQLEFWRVPRAAWVDVGWHGTVQDALARTFAADRRWPSLLGQYMAFHGDPFVADSPGSRFEGLWYHRGRDPMGRSPHARFLQLFEFATRAPHATTVALQRDPVAGLVVPVFKSEEAESRQVERKDRATITRLQEGIFDFADAYARTIPLHEHPPEEHTPFVLLSLDRLLRFPRADEARALAIHHSEDFALEWSQNNPRMRWHAWRRDACRGSLWPEGVLASSGIPGLAAIYGAGRALAREF